MEKYFRFLLLYFLLSSTAIISGMAQQPQYVTLKGPQFKDYNGADFYPLMVNYLVSLVYNTTTQSYTFAPYINYGGNQGFEHPGDVTATLNDIERDFDVIVNMGFNTVHLVGASPATRVEAGVLDGFKFFTFPNWTYSAGAHHLVVSPCTNDNELPKIFQALDAVIARAANAGLKVIIDCQTDDRFTSSQIAEIDYNCYLQLLAQHFNTNTTLIAYILTGEASNNDYYTSHPKGQVCELVKGWYKSIRDNDPNHLIGCGFFNVDEIRKWDPGVMKMDFLFVHLYLNYFDYEDVGLTYHNTTAAMDRYYAQCYWLQQNCPVPWMVAETGFNCEDPAVSPKNKQYNGDWNEQQLFLQAAMDAIYQYGGSGVAIWSYQDGWNCSTVTPQNPLPVCDFYGLLKRGDQYNLGFPPTSLYKPCVSDFQNYFASYPTQVNTTLQPPPINYYDINHNLNYSQFGHANDLTGTVTDQDGKPVKDAFLIGYTYEEWTPFPQQYPDGYPIAHVFSTFTDPSGHYSLTPFNTLFPNDSTVNYIYFLIVCATGCNNDYAGNWLFNPNNGMPPSLTSPLNFTLNRISTLTNQDVQNTTVFNSEVRAFNGYKTLAVYNNVEVEPAGIADFKAKYEVSLGSNFHASYGSETHIYNEQVFAECDEINGNPYTFRPGGNSTNSTSRENNKIIDIYFKKRTIAESILVYPNPSDALFTIEYKGNPELKKQIEAFDVMGKKILVAFFTGVTSSLTLINKPKGIYSLQIKTETGLFNQKIIVQ